jgi:hypothetical protein
MGGTLQLEAVFPDAAITITTLGELADSSEQHAAPQEAVGR